MNTLFYDASLRGSLCSARDPRKKVMAELLLASWSPDIEVECAQSRKQKQALRVHPANVSAQLRGDKDKTWGRHPSTTAGVWAAAKPLTSGLGTLREQR